VEAQLLFTVFALVASCAASYFAWVAGDYARKAAHHEHRLAIMRGQVAGLEAAMMGLHEQHKKLAGRVYADQYWNGQRAEQPMLEPVEPDGRSRDICENWATAQREGPSSRAAGCECAYCNARRADRAARRAKLRVGVKT
jgi:hypothetical protein